jgi:hypothetical protein
LRYGKIDEMRLIINRPKLSPKDIKKLQTAQRNNNKMSE